MSDELISVSEPDNINKQLPEESKILDEEEGEGLEQEISKILKIIDKSPEYEYRPSMQSGYSASYFQSSHRPST